MPDTITTFFIAAVGLGCGFIAMVAVHAYRRDLDLMRRRVDYLQRSATDLSVEVVWLSLIVEGKQK
ncbi:MAG: hypothetical protein EBR82_22470 [Caulobacteraceae bacterium]|nr:hypothetical protein [Caulobacteraceae bacterium]